ncbi:hypothetical protein [Amycolatopsis sp. lyj-90]|uniref:hypothetical protein n=1 Tax=Amycolatopsis sp. lyj-90 TaxID=2789285 RepID=UPI00397BA2BB
MTGAHRGPRPEPSNGGHSGSRHAAWATEVPAPTPQRARLLIPRPRRVDLPPTNRWQKFAKRPAFFHYHRLAAGIIAINAVLLFYRQDLSFANDATLVNLTLAVLIRQRHVINALWTLVRLTPPHWPRWFRRSAGKVYHIGGIHVGGSIAAVGWFVVLVVQLTRSATGPGPLPVSLVLAYFVCALLIGICVLALPVVRRNWHNLFERTHRFGGWLALAMMWAQTVVTSWELSGGLDWYDLLTAPQLWVLMLVTTSVVLPWLSLRRVPITVSHPSRHAAIVTFHEAWQPFAGSTTAFSRSAFGEWHSFATIAAAPGTTGYRVIVSRAGDWTSRFIDAPPDHVWVRGGSVHGVGGVDVLANRLLWVVTGSGIGPALSPMFGRPRNKPLALLWVTRDPRKTYGNALVDEVLSLVPDALIINTDQAGKPDVVTLAHRVATDFRADAVVCVANKKLTWAVVNELERRGIPTHGAIWDS